MRAAEETKELEEELRKELSKLAWGQKSPERAAMEAHAILLATLSAILPAILACFTSGHITIKYMYSNRLSV